MLRDEDDFDNSTNKLVVDVEATTVANAVDYAKDKLATVNVVKVEMLAVDDDEAWKAEGRTGPNHRIGACGPNCGC
jgi:hypothetical protein